MTVAEDILTIVKLARRIVARGWTQNQSCVKQPGGRECCCMSTALAKAACSTLRERTSFEPIRGLAVVEVANRIPRFAYIANPWRRIEAWNDCRGRNKEQVLELFDRVIDELEEELRQCANPAGV